MLGFDVADRAFFFTRFSFCGGGFVTSAGTAGFWAGILDFFSVTFRLDLSWKAWNKGNTGL